MIDRGIEDISETRRIDFELLSVRSDSINDAARGKNIAIVSSTIRHPRQQMIITPNLWNRRTIRSLCQLRVITADQIQGLTIRRRDHGMHSMITFGVNPTQQFDLIQLVIAVRVRDSIQTALQLLLIVIYADIQGTEGKNHPVDGSNINRHLFDIGRFQLFACSRWHKPIEPAKLIARINPALVVSTQVDPRSFFNSRYGVQQLHVEIFRSLNTFNRSRFILADRRANRDRAILCFSC